MTVSAHGEEAVVGIAIARDAALVRTARLVAAAVARRADLPGALIEEVRLGVGEACAILIGSVDLGVPRADADDMLEVSLRNGAGFSVEVRGCYQLPNGDLDDLGLDPWALLRGVTDEVSIDIDGDWATITMKWPA